MEHQDLLAGFVRRHILHHAAAGDLYGQRMIEEPGRHGYKPGAGGDLTSRTERTGRSQSRIDRATPSGGDARAPARQRRRGPFHEVPPREGPDRHGTARRRQGPSLTTGQAASLAPPERLRWPASTRGEDGLNDGRGRRP